MTRVKLNVAKPNTVKLNTVNLNEDISSLREIDELGARSQAMLEKNWKAVDKLSLTDAKDTEVWRCLVESSNLITMLYSRLCEERIKNIK